MICNPNLQLMITQLNIITSTSGRSEKEEGRRSKRKSQTRRRKGSEQI